MIHHLRHRFGHTLRHSKNILLLIVFVFPLLFPAVEVIPADGKRTATATITQSRENVILSASQHSRSVERFVPLNDAVAVLRGSGLNGLAPTEIVTLRSTLSFPPLVLSLLYTVTVTSFL